MTGLCNLAFTSQILWVKVDLRLTLTQGDVMVTEEFFIFRRKSQKDTHKRRYVQGLPATKRYSKVDHILIDMDWYDEQGRQEFKLCKWSDLCELNLKRAKETK